MKNVKNILLSLTFVFILAQTGLAITGAYDVKGRLTDTKGVNRNGIYAIKFSIFDAATYGNELWGRAIGNINIGKGLFQVVLEGEDDTGRNFGTITKKDQLYLEIKLVGGPGVSGQEPPLSPRQRLTEVPYALSADSVAGLSALRGIIAMWSGSSAEVPEGWCICDGRTCAAPDGTAIITPDLKDRFLLGTGETTETGAIGGSDNPYIDPPEIQTSDIKSEAYITTEPGLDNGASKIRWHYVNIPPFQMGTQALYPKFYKLAFIMRL